MIEYFKTILPIIAIGISIYSLIISKKNSKRQIRYAKLEEMVEIFFYVVGHYWHFRILIEDLKSIKEDNITSEKNPRTSIYRKDIEKLREKEVFEKLSIKINRIGILSNSYLPNGILKMQILSICKLLRAMMESLDNENLIPIHHFSDNLPSRPKFAKLIEKIEQELISEMDLGFKSLKWDDLGNYYKNDFMKEFESKS